MPLFDNLAFDPPKSFSYKCQALVKEECSKVLKASALAANADPSNKTVLERMQKWFGKSQLADIQRGARAMHSVLMADDRSVRFVDRRKGQIQTGVKYCSQNDSWTIGTKQPLGETVAGVVSSNARWGSSSEQIPKEYGPTWAYDPQARAYVRDDSPRGPLTPVWVRQHWAEGQCLAHAGSGMRIYLGPRFFQAVERALSGLYSGFLGSITTAFVENDTYQIPITIYHEISHKVLRTEDVTYDIEACYNLAKTDPDKAILNAESWAYYVMGFVISDLEADY